ncbi:putative membrane protein [Bacillus sp. OxB-1]|nr:putative membrane protein [Bacillus sp. OxB-1]
MNCNLFFAFRVPIPIRMNERVIEVKNIYGYLMIAFPLLLIGAWLMTDKDGKDYRMRLESVVGFAL